MSELIGESTMLSVCVQYENEDLSHQDKLDLYRGQLSLIKMKSLYAQ
jgi:hypothetical protein